MVAPRLGVGELDRVGGGADHEPGVVLELAHAAPTVGAPSANAAHLDLARAAVALPRSRPTTGSREADEVGGERRGRRHGVVEAPRRGRVGEDREVGSTVCERRPSWWSSSACGGRRSWSSSSVVVVASVATGSSSSSVERAGTRRRRRRSRRRRRGRSARRLAVGVGLGVHAVSPRAAPSSGQSRRRIHSLGGPSGRCHTRVPSVAAMAAAPAAPGPVGLVTCRALVAYDDEAAGAASRR